MVEDKIKLNSPNPVISIGARIRTAIPPPMIINTHMAKMNTKIDDPLKGKPPS